jgi:signal transduction histidine kinase
MNRILLLIENKTNRALLAEWLAQRYEVVQLRQGISLATSFDLCLLDGPTLDRNWQQILTRKAEDEPTFLPFVLITSHRETELITRHLWKAIDELVRVPIEKLDLQARVEMLLRTRRLSLELRLRNEDLKSFFHAMTHDLRAPLRAVRSFSDLLGQEDGARLSKRGGQDLERIRLAAKQMQELIDGLVAFARIEYSSQQLQPVALEQVVDQCLFQLEHEIMKCQAVVKKQGTLPIVRGNKTLLMVAISNLLSNALKFVSPGTSPCVAIQSHLQEGMCRLEIADNGIGIPLQAQSQLFSPFVQLHGVETYGGIGLGLATVRKSVEMLGGRIGVISQEGRGSIFWIDLYPLEEGHSENSLDR